tara:strand:- start:107 stop:220 length:114 start_codon:yes stop_codon:yes gene_type:complete
VKEDKKTKEIKALEGVLQAVAVVLLVMIFSNVIEKLI